MHQKTSLAIVLAGLALVTLMYVSAGGQDAPTVAYYQGGTVKVTMKALDPSSAAAVLARNSPTFNVYTAESCEPEGRMFLGVLDSIRNDGTGGMWRRMEIEFNPGYPCRQFTSVDEIAAAVKSGEISLSPTGYVYRCRLASGE